MIVVNGLNEHFKNSAVAIGNFDGVHLGHRHLLGEMLKNAVSSCLTPSVLTFDPHPERFYNMSIPEITTREQKNRIFENMGIKLCYYAKFDKDFAELPPEDFYQRYIVDILDAKSIYVGFDFKFGKNRAGDAELLAKLSANAGIACTVVPAYKLDSEIVSSTKIRAALASGDCKTAARFLGRDYSCTGTVVAGDKLGRTIGFPTANLHIDNDVITPDGVYAGYTYIDGKRYVCMIYIGTRPTLPGNSIRRFEVNILNFSREIYSEKLEIFYKHMIRGSIRFNNMEDLKEQLAIDREIVQSAQQV